MVKDGFTNEGTGIKNELPGDLTTYPKGNYNRFPSFVPSNGNIEQGYEKLADRIIEKTKNGLRVLMIDGYHGIDWEEFQTELDKCLNSNGAEPEWISINNCLADEDEIFNRIEKFLGNSDRIFGSHFPAGPEVFFDYKKLADLRIEMAIRRGKKAGSLTIVYGTGAGLLELWDELFYVDIAKDFIQEKFREFKINNIGTSQKTSFEEFYKRSYFVEWPALNR